MKSQLSYRRYPLLLVFLWALVACSGGSTDAEKIKPVATLNVYKSLTCECCQHWLQHMDDAGLDTKVHHPADLNQIKNDYGIAPEFQSCHTAVSPEGYVFEGHIPARFIQEFLENPPAGATGLSVPGMPVGSPGMEVGNRFTPYQVLLMKKDGTTDVFVSVERAAQQYQPDDKREERP